MITISSLPIFQIWKYDEDFWEISLMEALSSGEKQFCEVTEANIP